MRNLFNCTIGHVCFGEDISNMKFEIDVRTSDSSNGFERKQLSMSDSILETLDQITELAAYKWSNPLYQGFRKLTGIKNFTSYHTTNTENCKRIRETIKIYV